MISYDRKIFAITLEKAYEVNVKKYRLFCLSNYYKTLISFLYKKQVLENSCLTGIACINKANENCMHVEIFSIVK